MKPACSTTSAPWLSPAGPKAPACTPPAPHTTRRVARAAALIEPTGVGDAFRAGLLIGLSRGYAWPATLRLANLTAVYVIEQMGTQNHRYTSAEFAARYRANYGDDEILRDFEM